MDFKQTKQAYARLKDEFQQGRITAEEFEARVNEMVVTDSAGMLWQIGVKTGIWYRFDGQQWVEDIPPGFERPAAPAQAAYVPQSPPVVTQSEPAYRNQNQPGKNTWLGGFLIAGILGSCCLVIAVGGWLAWSNNPLSLDLPIAPTLAPTTIPPFVPPSIPSAAPIVPSPVLPEPGTTALPGFLPDEVLFQDDFSNPASGWDDVRVDDQANTYYFEDKYLFVIYTPDLYAWANPYLNFPGDVRVEVDASKSSGSQFDEYGPICRYTRNSDDTYSYYYFAIAIDGLGVIYKVDHDDKSLVITDPPANRSDVIHAGDQVNRIRADCTADTLTLYVNGEPLVSAIDSSFTSGDVGLRVDSETGETEVIFDNFIVYKPGS